MSVEVIFPKVDMDMQSGELIEWLCKSGDHVREGEPLFVIETDKSGMEVEALCSGTLVIIEDLSGQQVPVGQVMAHIYKDGESISDSQAPEKTVQKSAKKHSTIATEEVVSQVATAASAESGVVAAFTNSLTLTSGSESGSRASPAARKLARENNLALSDIVGTSHRGRIVKSDVEAHLAAVATSQVCSTDAAAMLLLVDSPAAGQILPHSNMRKIIASRLTTACLTIPSYQVSIDCNCESLLRLKREIEQLTDIRSKSTNGSEIVTPKVTLNDFFVKALALSLRDHPMANSSWTEDARIVHASVDIGIAVALVDGLITPIVRNAARKSISEISIETKSLIMRANNGTLTRSDYQGGASTISNLGMYGITQFTSIVNPPQASILSVGQVQRCPVVIDDALSIAPVCKMTFTFDHRLIDGAVGAKLAASFKTYVENATTMVI
jgi:pyruvate dehydrogenase E2 component (dihydrolipoamide acetyltransferase)